jgi:glycosyltransferase involved in cell wall biosynthesis
MRVLHLAHCYPPAIGGSEVLIEQISRRLVADHGDDVTVITTTAYTTAPFRGEGGDVMEEGVEDRDGVEVRRHHADARVASAVRRIHRPAWRLRVPGNSLLRTVYDGPVSPAMLRDALRSDADIVGATAFPLLHMHYALLAARRQGVPLVLYGALHGEDPWGYDRATIRHLARSADAYVAYTRHEADLVVGMGVAEANVRVIPPGIEPSELDPSGWDVRGEFDIPDDAFLFGFIGQLGRGKGVFTLLEAFALMADDIPGSHLLLAGGATADVPKLEQRLRRLPTRIAERVRIHTDFPASRKGDLFRALDVFVTPSHNESFGITTVEAWHCGVPVVAARLAAVDSLVRHGVDALLVERGDEYDLAGAMVEVFADEVFRASLAAAGRERARALTWADTASAVDALYRELVG